MQGRRHVTALLYERIGLGEPAVANTRPDGTTSRGPGLPGQLCACLNGVSGGVHG